MKFNDIANAISVVSGVTLAGIVGVGAYVYVNKDAIIENIKEQAIESVMGSVGVGGALGGRVICNELCNQGIIDRKMLINDYKFTRDYLSPSHVKGYHLWAIWMVKQMRKGKFVGFWSHIVIHRGNEIAYIYGERKKPDYLGKLYRKIFEPVCWVLGAFSKQTDWSILYQKKEI